MSVHPDAPVAAPDDLTEAERTQIAPYVTCTNGPVFALVNLPESVKGALFARYSRSAKSLRRILLEEFLPEAPPAHDATNRAEKADAFYGRVLAEYGDDSVAQLGAAHIAVEGASNVLTKVIEWGRLASYLEQSTRYVAYDDRPGGTYRYHRPSAVMERPSLREPYTETLDAAFGAYATLLPQMVEHLTRRMPIGEVPEAAHRRAVRARALDSIRGLLPAATRSNVGIFASGQAYEAMLVRMLAHPLAEARATAALILEELRKVIPAFLTRVDRPDRGERHGAYLRELDATAAELATEILGLGRPEADGPIVRLVDFDPDGEARVLAHALWSANQHDLLRVLRNADRILIRVGTSRHF